MERWTISRTTHCLRVCHLYKGKKPRNNFRNSTYIHTVSWMQVYVQNWMPDIFSFPLLPWYLIVTMSYYSPPSERWSLVCQPLPLDNEHWSEEILSYLTLYLSLSIVFNTENTSSKCEGLEVKLNQDLKYRWQEGDAGRTVLANSLESHNEKAVFKQ